MNTNWSRRILLAWACVGAALLSACGSSTIESALTPARFISFGDGLSYLGNASGAGRQTVNDVVPYTNINIWTEELAASYGLKIKSSAAGGTSYAQAHARVTNAVGANGAPVPSIKSQIDSFLAVDKFGANDVVVINGGISDIVAETEAFRSGSITNEQLLTNVDQAGKDLAAQVRRVVSAGAKYVLVLGVYGLGKSPYATDVAQTALLDKLSYVSETDKGRPRSFNEALLISMVDLGNNVLFADLAYQMNVITASPTSYLSSGVATGYACVAPAAADAGNGIGTGTNQVNSALCTTSTVAATPGYNSFVFADRIYPTPAVQKLIGDFAASKLRSRW